MNRPTTRLTREDCEAAAKFVADLENYVTDLDDGYCELVVSLYHPNLRHVAATVQRMAEELDTWKRRAYELESIASDRL